MNRSSVLFTIIFIGLFVALGCSGGGGNPVTPDAGPAVTVETPGHAAQTQTCLWGYWDVYVDLETMTVEAIPNRSTMFTANMVGIMNNIPTTLGFHINETVAGPGYIDIDLDISITHPMPGKPKFNGYDVRGVFMGNGSFPLAYNNDLIYPVLGTDQMMLADPDDGFGGPDGYTRWFNRPEFSEGGLPLLQYTQGRFAPKTYSPTATLCPYKYFTDTLAATGDLWTYLTSATDNGVFSSGSTNIRNYYLRFPSAVGIKYGYAILANWQGGQPGDHPSNAPETVGCSIVDDSTVYYASSTAYGGDLIMDLSFFGWNYQPSQVYIESTVLSAPHMFDAGEMTPVGGNEAYSTYHVDIPADNITGVEGNEFWVIAESGAFDYTNPFGVPNLADGDTLAAFFRYDLEVSTEVQCPTPEVQSIWPPAGNPGTSVDATIQVSTLEEGPALAAALVMGVDVINGTGVTFVDPTHLSATFNLTGAPLGTYDVVVTNGCGGVPGTGIGLFTVTDCVAPDPVTIDITCAETGDILDDLPIHCANLVDGACLNAKLMLSDVLEILGTNIQFISDTEMTADFDLSTAIPGTWDLSVVNGCCSPPASTQLQIMFDPGPITMHAEGNLPVPLPFPDEKNFCVVGDPSGGHQGVYYFGDNYDVMYYPIDYSSGGQLYFTMEGNYGIDTEDFFGQPNELGPIEVDATGGMSIVSRGTGILWDVNEQNMCAIWFSADNPVVENALTIFSTSGTIRTKDVEGGLSADSILWTLFGTEIVIDPGIEVVLAGIASPYNPDAFDPPNGGGWSTGWAPLDQVGSVDGEVSDLEDYRLGMDDEPQGLAPTELDLIFYYLEGAPDDPGIEVFAASLANLGTDRILLTTIDTGAFTGTPVDLSVVNTAGNLGCVDRNWLCVLEDNGDHTFQVAVFDQNGNFIDRSESFTGDPLGLDCDNERREVHVWSDDVGVLEYHIFGWMH